MPYAGADEGFSNAGHFEKTVPARANHGTQSGTDGNTVVEFVADPGLAGSDEIAAESEAG